MTGIEKILESINNDAKRKAEKKKTNKFKLIPSPTLIVSIIAAICVGSVCWIATLMASADNDKAAAIVIISATIGIIVKTRKKASCPGNILISGLINNWNIFSINSLVFFILSPFIYNLLCL